MNGEYALLTDDLNIMSCGQLQSSQPLRSSQAIDLDRGL